ncbi:DUF5789 family protein [Haloarchaeobius sp. TZWWS8]|uniref:DUF5789 family protein n=1 Tax=Haloarchaeobius sp. TZWWS8 TaxID=3446121 RepID=UPI003EBD047E
MTQQVKLNDLERVLSGLSYPVFRDEAATELSDVTLQLADGEANLGDIVSRAETESFATADELHLELQEHMPIEAVGEPGQSEGEG